MGVKKGYKQTEVGVIPEDWSTMPCSALSDLITVGIVVRPTQYYVEQGVPALRSANIREKGIVDADMVHISETSNALLSKSQIRSGDVLTVRTGYPGTSAVVPSRFEGANCIDILITRPTKALSPTFLSAWINSSHGKYQVLRGQGGLAQKHFNVGDLRGLLVALPPTMAEQEAIAEALSDADALIESLEQLLAKKRHLKQGAMQELLTGKKRLLGFAGKWEIKRLEELADIRSGGTPSTTQTQFWDGDIPWCTPTDITALDGFKFLSDTNRRISDQGLEASSAEMIPANSIVMTSRATIGECAINHVPVSTNQGFKNFVPFENVDTEFLYYLLHLQKQGFISLCGGSTFLEIGKTQLAKYEVRMPSTKSEQFAIATILSDMDTEIAALETKLTKACQLKTGMMQELLTGRIRLVGTSASAIPFLVEQRGDLAPSKAHNPQINEAVVLAILTSKFGTEQYPLARVRRTKMMYLLHRHVEHQTTGFLKKAAGPYNPQTRYGGPEKIALKNHYVRAHHNGTYEGFVSAGKIAQAEEYFEKWYGSSVMEWMEQFRHKRTEELELLATIDMACEDLRREGKATSLSAVKHVLQSNTEWKAKLDKPVFSDQKIDAAIEICQRIFSPEGENA